MKKLYILLLVFLLIGCKKTDDISIIVPYGSPQLSQLYLQQNEDYAVDVVIGPEPLLAAFGSESHDVIFAPINLGAKLFTANENYTLLSVVTWGNYFFICPTSVTEISQLQGQTVVVFGQNQVSDILVKLINEIYQLNLTISYVDSLSSATAYVLTSFDHITLLAEPSLSLVQSMVSEDYAVIDLQSVYQQITGESMMPQAGVFVHQRLSTTQKAQIKDDLEQSILQTNTQVEQAAELAITLGMDIEKDILMDAISNSHLVYQDAHDSKASIEIFFSYILQYQPALIGNMLPKQSFYED